MKTEFFRKRTLQFPDYNFISVYDMYFFFLMPSANFYCKILESIRILNTIPPPPGGAAILPEYIHYYGYYYQVIVQCLST
jgi:hypothetical protein